MAKFAKWADWTIMARDVSNKLSHITFSDFDRSELIWHSFDFEISSASTMPLTTRTNFRGLYFPVGELVFVAMEGTVAISATGALSDYLTLTLPFNYDPVYESLFKLDASTTSTSNGTRVGASTQFYDDNKIRFWQANPSGTILQWTPGDTVQFNVFGFYKKAR